MGTSDIKSTPPATTTSDWPEAIWLTPTQTQAHKLNTLSLHHQYCIILLMGLTTCTKRWGNKMAIPYHTIMQGSALHYNIIPVATAMLDDIHAMVTVWHGIRSLNPDSIAA